MESKQLHKILIVGGGAGGLELATKLGDKLGKKKKAEITLIDAKKTHIWKPLLHEIAAGSINPDKDELDYLAQGFWHGFKFRLGRMDKLDREKKEVSLEPYFDNEGNEIIARRNFKYDTLIMSIGSSVNDFSVKGAAEFSIALDNQNQAERFHNRLHNAIVKAQTQKTKIQPGQLEVVIVGAGATGVELAAELHKATREMTAYGLENIDPDKDIRINLIEASPRLLPALPLRISQAVADELRKLKVNLFLGERVTEVTSEGIKTHKDRKILSSLVVWAAGIKAPDFLKNLSGLETNDINQLKVKSTLQTTLDANIFAFGDCASCPVAPDATENVPPRAQAAHQQASLLYKTIIKVVNGNDKLPRYVYKDYGSLVNLGRYSTVGNLMGSILGGNMFIEGLIAKLMYLSLYQMHLVALHGYASTFFRFLGKLFSHRTETRVKLH